jgi:hypothetical protein
VSEGSKKTGGRPNKGQLITARDLDIGNAADFVAHNEPLPLPPISSAYEYRTEERLKRMDTFLSTFQATFGNISQACIAAGISMPTYYDWRSKYPEFKEKVDTMNVDDVFVDWVESQLQSKIRAGDTASIIFALKTKGRKRGWEEKISVDNTQPQVVFNLMMPQRSADNIHSVVNAKFEELKAKSEEDNASVVNDVYGVEDINEVRDDESEAG